MKKWLSLFLILTTAGLSFAGPNKGGDRTSEYDFLQKEIEMILAQEKGKKIGEYTLEEALKLQGQLSIVRQKAAFIKKSKTASFIIPGIGQFMNKKPLAGTLFLAGDILTAAGTIIGAYFLLPADLRVDQLDYFNTPLATIKDNWKSKTFVDMLPSAAILAGGLVVHTVLRIFSSKNAAALARQNIAEGKITFEPQLSIGDSSHGGMGLE